MEIADLLRNIKANIDKVYSGPRRGRRGQRGGSMPRNAGAGAEPASAQAQPKPQGAAKPAPKGGDAQEGKAKPRKARGHIGEMNNAERVAILMQDLKCDKAEAMKVREAVSNWSGDGYFDIRQGKDKKREEILEKLVNNAPTWDSKGPLFRGITMPEGDAASLAKGSTIGMLGLSSWTSEEDIAKGFTSLKKGHSAVMFTVKKANRATSIEHLSTAGSDEEEVLYSGKAKFKVNNIMAKGRRYSVELEEL